MNDKIQETNRIIKDLQQKKQLIDSIVKDKSCALKRLIGFVLLLLVIGWGLLIKYVGWEVMDMWTSIVGPILPIMSMIISYIFDKTINPKALFIRYDRYLLDKLCRLYDYNDTMLEDCEQTLESLERQLKEEEK